MPGVGGPQFFGGSGILIFLLLTKFINDCIIPMANLSHRHFALYTYVSLNRVSMYKYKEGTVDIYIKDTMMVHPRVNMFCNLREALCSIYSSDSKQSKSVQLQGGHHGHLHQGHHEGPSHGESATRRAPWPGPSVHWRKKQLGIFKNI